MKNNHSKLSDYLQLSKLTIMLPVSLTGFTGYFIYNPHLSIRLILVSLGVLLMAISASALNQIQEARQDAEMNRTRNRPIPSGRIKKQNALIFSMLCLAAGAFIISASGNFMAALAGLFTIIWYNGVYTFFKRITVFAVVPGALTGALPPLVGWLAAGGGIWDKEIIFLEFLFFTGQIPHFWLLVLKYSEEYKHAGFPVLTDIFTKDQINRLTFTWILASVMAALFLSYFGIITSWFLTLTLLLASAFIILKFSGLLKPGADERSTGKYSMMLYMYFLVVILILITDRLLSP
jgi:protoheme IX farnesyltransferase